MAHQRKPGGKWSIRYRLIPSGKNTTRVVGHDRRAAEALERKLRQDFKVFQITGMLPAAPDDRKPPKPIREYLRPYLEHLDHRPDKYLRAVEYRVRKVLEVMGDQLTLDQALRRIRLDGLSARTVDAYRATLVAFGRWLGQNGVPNTLWSAATFYRPGTETFSRMALTLDQAKALCAATPERADLYWTALTTGMRRHELVTLTWADIRDGMIHLPAERTKSKRAARIPLQAWVAEMLEERRSFGATRVFDETHIQPEVLRRDAESAGLWVENGLRLDFHALRGSCCSILCEMGVPLDAIQEVMRHASFTTTAKHYRQVRSEVLQRQVQIPDPREAM